MADGAAGEDELLEVGVGAPVVERVGGDGGVAVVSGLPVQQDAGARGAGDVQHRSTRRHWNTRIH